MKVIWTKNTEQPGIHIYDERILPKMIIPYERGKLKVKSIVYMHDNIPDKTFEVVGDKKEQITNTLNKVFNISYKKEPVKKHVWIDTVEKKKNIDKWL